MKNYLWLILAALLLPALLLAPAVAQDAKPTKEKKTESDENWPECNLDAEPPSEQPEKGPGGKDYKHKEVEVYEGLSGGEHYWLYTPAEPRPKKAPVVVFVHGYGAMKPEGYEAWLHHLCKRGNIVIYPQYQAHGLEAPTNYAPNCATSILDAFQHLEADEKLTQPIKEDFAIVGHSAGGVTTANLAADYELLKLPKPKAAMPVQPGRAFNYQTQGQKKSQLIPFSDFSKIPEDCLLLCVFGDSDTTVGSYCAKYFFVNATSVKTENKNLVEFPTCEYCGKPCVAGHRTPAGLINDEGVDYLDWYGYWKLFDGLTDAAFYGKNREYALGDTPEQKFMGKYSDGRPVTPLKVWLGDAKVDPEEEYEPLYDRSGNRTEPKPEKDAEPKKEAPSKGKKEDEEEF
ncbi:MAG: alpha/beta fold hydrolase [Planctomycetes bacterium]|nr:alpha/beta fold hydrolase [Planctomycetota bacterium]